jgi:PIN domain nuclease of toxin-antitoxin system
LTPLLDTHVLLWWVGGSSLLPKAHDRVIKRASDASPLWVSDISLWEIATLVELGRIQLHLPLRDWLEAATAPPLVRRVGVTPAIATEVAALPSTFHRDPADRILVATARVLGATLLTKDRRIVDAALVPTLG